MSWVEVPGGACGDPLELLVGVLVARPDPLEVEHREAAERLIIAAVCGADDAVHRRGEQRQLEAVRTERSR